MTEQNLPPVGSVWRKGDGEFLRVERIQRIDPFPLIVAYLGSKDYMSVEDWLDWSRGAVCVYDPTKETVSVSVEQTCRDILEMAIRDNLVCFALEWNNPDPQCRTSGELCGVANLLAERMRGNSPNSSIPTQETPAKPERKTVRVRAAVFIAPQNPAIWVVSGTSEMTDEEIAKNAGRFQHIACIESDIPLPDVPTVEGVVTETKKSA